MTKKAHIAVAFIACSTSIIVCDKLKIDYIQLINSNVTYLYLLFITALGAIAPDLDYVVCSDYEDRMKLHRQLTHSLLLWSIFLALSLYLKNYVLVFFAFGGVSHLIADYFTGDIPVLLWGKRTSWDEPKNKWRIGVNNWAKEKYVTEEELNNLNINDYKILDVDESDTGVQGYTINKIQKCKKNILNFSSTFYVVYTLVGLVIYILYI